MTWSVLHDACEHQDTQTVIYRSRSNSEEAVLTDEHGSTPLHIASVDNPPLSVITALLDAHPHAVLEKDIHGDTPLHVALSNRSTNLDLIELLLNSNPGVASVYNKEGLMPIHVACRFSPGNAELISMLVKAHSLALHSHIKMGDPAPRRKQSPISIKPYDHAVTDAIPRQGKSSLELRFHERGKQVRDGSYPLHIAISNHAPPNVIQILIEGAPDVLTMKNKFGATPLHIALEIKAPKEVIGLLLSADSAPASMTDKHLNLPLHIACLSGYDLEVVKHLVEVNPSAVHAKNMDGKTPFLLNGLSSEDVMLFLKNTSLINSATQ